MHILHDHIALHTWTLDSTPLGEALRIANATGYNAVELRHADFMRMRQSGMGEQAMVQTVRDAGIRVAVVGTENGVLFDSGAELERLLGSLRYVCEKAVALGCSIVMTPPGQFIAEGAALASRNLKMCADIAAGHGLRLALEFNSRHPTINTLESAMDVINAVDMPHCGLLVDTYHLHRSGGNAASVRLVPVERIVTVQFSDVPASPPSNASVATDRLPPGAGTVPFVDILRALVAMDYQGYLSYEAPNPEQWSRPPEVVAREGVERMRALLQQAEQAH